MKKFSIVGLLLSLFVAFTFVSCGKDDEPKKEEGNPLVGKSFYRKSVKDHRGIKYIYESTLSFTANQVTITEKEYTEPAIDDRANGNSITVLQYTYDTKTSIIKLIKVISSTEDGVDITKKEQEDFKKKEEKLQKEGKLVISYKSDSQKLSIKHPTIKVIDEQEIMVSETNIWDLKK